jgi:hypothetical protein
LFLLLLLHICCFCWSMLFIIVIYCYLCCLPFVVCCMLFVVCRLFLFVVCCLQLVIYFCLLLLFYCLLFIVCFVLFAFSARANNLQCMSVPSTMFSCFLFISSRWASLIDQVLILLCIFSVSVVYKLTVC